MRTRTLTGSNDERNPRATVLPVTNRRYSLVAV
jgi:hypothetical protein